MDRPSDILHLLLEHRAALFAFIYAMVRDFAVAEDVFQEVSLAVWESREEFQIGTSFGAWSRDIARRRVLAHYRAEGRFPGLLSDDELAQIQAGFDELDNELNIPDRLTALRHCIRSLAPVPRRLLELRYAAGMDLAHMAAKLGRRQESIRKALHRTRQFLRDCIERRLGLEGAR